MGHPAITEWQDKNPLTFSLLYRRGLVRGTVTSLVWNGAYRTTTVVDSGHFTVAIPPVISPLQIGNHYCDQSKRWRFFFTNLSWALESA